MYEKINGSSSNESIGNKNGSKKLDRDDGRSKALERNNRRDKKRKKTS